MTSLTAPSLSCPPPRYATPKPAAPTLGPAITKTMRLLGYRPIPWQEWAADVIGERRPDGSPRWPTVIISVPRQSGKSTLVTSVAVHRILTMTDARVWLTAQTGADASDLWKECLSKVTKSPLKAAFTWRRANGTQELTCSLTGGVFKPHPPNEEKLHGKQSDLNIIDEAWVFDEAEASALMQAIEPTQATRPHAQTIIVSTMGTAKSTWFHGLVDQARAGDETVALLEWGIGPDDNPDDLELVAACHPAFGHTVAMPALVKAHSTLSAAGFARAYGNRPTGALERVIPLPAWKAAQSDDNIPADARVSFGAAVDIDRTETAIAAAWVDPDGIPMLEIVDRRPGTSWAAPRLRELLDKHDNAGLLVDHIGPSGPLFDELTRDGTEVDKLAAGALTASCAEFYDRVIDSPPRIKIKPSKALDVAAEVVTRRRVGDAWAWSRRSAQSIAPIEAATLAMYAASHQAAPEAAPMIRF